MQPKLVNAVFRTIKSRSPTVSLLVHFRDTISTVTTTSRAGRHSSYSATKRKWKTFIYKRVFLSRLAKMFTVTPFLQKAEFTLLISCQMQNATTQWYSRWNIDIMAKACRLCEKINIPG